MDEPAGTNATPRTNRRVAGTRRSFLKWTGIAAAGTAVVAVGAKALSSGSTGSAGAPGVAPNATLPSPVATLPSQLQPVMPIPELGIEGITPLITPNADFFRIDTAFSIPRVDLSKWRLDVKGNVRSPFSLTYDELLAMPQVEAPVTLACVSNRVGGDLIGTAVWQGVELRTLLDRAGVETSGEQIVGRSVDGFTAGFPTSAAIDGRSALVAIGMNGVPLPPENGFPARLIVEGMFGYVSSTKWLSSIELTTWDGFNGYWIQEGWAKNGPIKMSSRIDVPREGATQSEGVVTIAGVAWAPNAGVAGVDVRIDDQWHKATLGDALSGGVWRQWFYDWTATKGEHDIAVRCVSTDGHVQTSDITTRPIDGYSGWDTRTITVR